MGFLTVLCLLYLRFIRKLNRAFYEFNVELFSFVERYFESFLIDTIADSILRQVDAAASEDKVSYRLCDSKSNTLQDNASTQTNRETQSSTGNMLICKLLKMTRTVNVSCSKSDSEESSSEYEECDNNCATISDDVVVIDFNKLPYENVKAKWNVNTGGADSFKVFKAKVKAKVSETGNESTPESSKESEYKGREGLCPKVHECSVSTNEILSLESGDALISKVLSKECYETAAAVSSEIEKTIPEHELQNNSMSASPVKDAEELFDDKALESSAHKNNTNFEILADVSHEEKIFGSSVQDNRKDLPSEALFSGILSDTKDTMLNLSSDRDSYFQDLKPKSEEKSPETKNEPTSEACGKTGQKDSYLEVNECVPSSKTFSSHESGDNYFLSASSIKVFKTAFIDSSETVKPIVEYELHKSSMFLTNSVTAAKKAFEDQIVEASKTDLETSESVINEDIVFGSFDHESHKDVTPEAVVQEIPSESKEVKLNLSIERPTTFQDFKHEAKSKAQETENEFTTQACTKSDSKTREDAYLEVQISSETASEISYPGNAFFLIPSIEFCKTAAISFLDTKNPISKLKPPKHYILVKAAEEVFEDKTLESSDNENLKNTDLETSADAVHEEIALGSSYVASKDVSPEIPVHDITKASAKVSFNPNTKKAVTFKVFNPKAKVSETGNMSNSELCKISESKVQKHSHAKEHDFSTLKNEALHPENRNDSIPKVPAIDLCKTVAIDSSDAEKAISENELHTSSTFESSEKAAVEVFENIALESSVNTNFNNVDTFANVVKDVPQSSAGKAFADMELESHISAAYKTLDDMELQCSEPLVGKALEVAQTESLESPDYNVLEDLVLESPKSPVPIALDAEHKSNKSLVQKALEDVNVVSPKSQAHKSLEEVKFESDKSPIHKALEDVNPEFPKSLTHKAFEDVNFESYKSPVHQAIQGAKIESPKSPAHKTLEKVKLESHKSPIHKALEDVKLESPKYPAHKSFEEVKSELQKSPVHKTLEDVGLESPKSPAHKALEDVKFESYESPVHKDLQCAKLESPTSPVHKTLKGENLESPNCPTHKALKDGNLETPEFPVHKAPQSAKLESPTSLVHKTLKEVNLESHKFPMYKALEDVEHESPKSPVHESLQGANLESPKSSVHKTLEEVNLDSHKSPVHKALDYVKLESPKSPAHKAFEDAELELYKYLVHKALQGAKLKSPLHKTLEEVNVESPKFPVHKALEDVEHESAKSPVRKVLENVELKSPEYLVGKGFEDVHSAAFKSLVRQALEVGKRKSSDSPVRTALEYMDPENFEPSSQKGSADMELEYEVADACEVQYDEKSGDSEYPTYKIFNRVSTFSAPELKKDEESKKGSADMELEYEVADACEVQYDEKSGDFEYPTYKIFNRASKFSAPELKKDEESKFQLFENIVLKTFNMDTIFETRDMKTTVLPSSSCKASKNASKESLDFNDNIDMISQYSKRESSEDNENMNDLNDEEDILNEVFRGKFSKPFLTSSSDALSISEIHSKEKLTDCKVDKKSVATALRNIEQVAESMIGASKVRLKKINDIEGKFFPLSNAKKSYVLGSEFLTAALKECQTMNLLNDDSTIAIEKFDLENLNRIIDELKLIQVIYCSQTGISCQKNESSASNQLFRIGTSSDDHTQRTDCDFATEEQLSKMSDLSDSNIHDSKPALHKNSSLQKTEIETSAKAMASVELEDFRQNSRLNIYLKNEKEENPAAFDTQSATSLFNEINEKSACPVLSLFNKATETTLNSDRNFSSQKYRNGPMCDCDRSELYNHIVYVFDPIRKRLDYSEGSPPFVAAEKYDFPISNPKTLPRHSPPPAYDESQKYFSRTCDNGKTNTKHPCTTNPIIVEISTSQNIKVADLKAVAETDHVVARDIAEAADLIMGDVTERAAGNTGDTASGVKKHTAERIAVSTGEVTTNTENIDQDINKQDPDCNKTLHKNSQGAEGNESSKVEQGVKSSGKPGKKSKKSKRKNSKKH